MPGGLGVPGFRLSYLKSTRLEHGLLISFGSYKFQIKKYVRSERPDTSLTGRLSSLALTFFAFFAFPRG